MTGAEILLQSLLNHRVNIIFGYPGSCVMAILDHLYNYSDSIKHILVRHEQGAIHAAHGYAQTSGEVGVALLTSGPGATNTVTGIADAMINSVPLVVITGQVHSKLIGTDAFQEVDIIGIAHSITKWTYQIRSASEISSAIAHAFYIASTGRPGPVLLDITKDAQTEETAYIAQKVNFIRSYIPTPYDQPFLASVPLSSPKTNDTMADLVIEILENKGENTILVLDLESNYTDQLKRLTSFYKIIQSERFRTIGFGLPAAIGTKYATPHKAVCLVVSSIRFQATIQELGVIMQSGIDIKILLVNNVSETMSEIHNPDFCQIMNAYKIHSSSVRDSDKLETEIEQAYNFEGSYFLQIII